jgi:carboxyl-terminal processing protease
MPLGFASDPGPGSLKITVQKFYRVAGGSTQKKGVIPDIVLPSMLDALELGETTLPYYLDYDEVPPVPHDNLDLTSAYLPDLRTNSAARVAASPDFAYVRQDITYYKKKMQDSTVSLNLAARQKEQADFKTLRAQRTKDLLARQASRDKELDLTLDMVDQNQPASPPVITKPKTDTSSDADPDEPDVDTQNPTDDPQLDEAVNIMTDYTRMLQDAGSKLVQAVPIAAPAK